MAIRGNRGSALPMTIIFMLACLALTCAFVGTSQLEPAIASNEIVSHSAAFFAESGIETVIWALNAALNNPLNPPANSISSLAAIPSQYTSVLPHGAGSTFFPLAGGGYTISVTPVGTNQAVVTATGWTPNNTTSPATKRIVTATLTSFAGRFTPPGALMVEGSLSLGGNSAVSGTTSTCGSKYGTYTGGTVTTTGGATTSSSAQGQPASSFTLQTLSAGELSALRDLAKAAGTYYQGTVTFNNLPGGIVFVDTVSGNPIGNPPNASDLANVTITGANSSGWLIVLGSLTIDGNVTYNGLIYVADSISYRGTGTGAISGSIITLNVLSPTSEVDQTSGNATINFDCTALNPPSGVPSGYFIMPKTWHEIAG